MEKPLPVNVTASKDHMNQPIDEVLRQWDVARAAFSSSLQTYLDAFSHFEILCSRFFDSKELGVSQPNVRTTLDEETLSLVAHERSIISTKSKLLRLKNSFTSISPIVALPTEVLARIFTLAVDSYRTYDIGRRCEDRLVSQVNTISSVCSYWRCIALGTGRIWSLIDFGRLRYADQVYLWLERAGEYPLDVVNMIHFDLPHVDQNGDPTSSLILHRIKYLRSFLRSHELPTERLISEWCINGAPRTLTTLALAASSRDMAEFPAQGETVNYQRLRELFHSLDTLYLCNIRVNWNYFKCHELVTLSLMHLNIPAVALRHVLVASPSLQSIYLKSLDIEDTPKSADPSLIQLRWLHTLHLEDFSHDTTCRLLGMMAPGSCRLTLKMNHSFTPCPGDAPRQDFIAFCMRTHITKLYCGSRYVLEDAIAAESKIEVLCFEYMTLDNCFYDLIAPPTNNDIGPSSGRSQSPLPLLHSLYIAGAILIHPEGFRRVVTTCSIREIGIGDSCYSQSGDLSGTDDLKTWVGPDINASFVMKKRETGYAPFDGR
ncbi:hypothetical protein BDV93DRAFT_609336 [Ceratobasidium sp. AG-I]|nr:hypothetical protein BDV93DRAFT_609336 [Ceratobasidium sp. AG-I]